MKFFYGRYLQSSLTGKVRLKPGFTIIRLRKSGFSPTVKIFYTKNFDTGSIPIAQLFSIAKGIV